MERRRERLLRRLGDRTLLVLAILLMSAVTLGSLMGTTALAGPIWLGP